MNYPGNGSIHEKCRTPNHVQQLSRLQDNYRKPQDEDLGRTTGGMRAGTVVIATLRLVFRRPCCCHRKSSGSASVTVPWCREQPVVGGGGQHLIAGTVRGTPIQFAQSRVNRGGMTHVVHPRGSRHERSDGELRMASAILVRRPVCTACCAREPEGWSSVRRCRGSRSAFSVALPTSGRRGGEGDT